MITVAWKEDTYETYQADPDDSWDRSDTETEVSEFAAFWFDITPRVSAYQRWGNSNEFDMPEAKPGDIIHAVVVQYSTGDSFGHDAGARVEVLDIFPVDEGYQASLLAHFTKDWTEGKSRKSHNISSYEFEWNGKTYHAGWTGYFEHLDRVWVETMIVGVL